MATILNLFPARIPFVSESRNLTPEAFRALTLLLERVGGPMGTSTTDMTDNVLEQQFMLMGA